MAVFWWESAINQQLDCDARNVAPHNVMPSNVGLCSYYSRPVFLIDHMYGVMNSINMFGQTPLHTL